MIINFCRSEILKRSFALKSPKKLRKDIRGFLRKGDRLFPNKPREEERMVGKVNKVRQSYLDLERVEVLQRRLEEALPNDSGLRLDAMIALAVLKDCFKCGFVERVGE